MKKQISSEAYYDLWLLLCRVNHQVMLARQKEIKKHNVPVRFTYVLCVIKDLGEKATISEIAKALEREEHVISRQAVNMEKRGLIKRIKNSSKSKLLRLELTEKGQNLVKFGRRSELIDILFSCLSREEFQQMESVLNRILVKLEEHTPIEI